MIKFGRYSMVFGWPLRFQTKVPVKVKHVLCFWFIKEAGPDDIDKKKQFPLGTSMEYEGRTYYYYRAGKDIKVGPVKESGQCQT